MPLARAPTPMFKYGEAVTPPNSEANKTEAKSKMPAAAANFFIMRSSNFSNLIPDIISPQFFYGVGA
jgi:hypothetical protein